MKYTDLRSFIASLEERGELHRITTEVDPVLEMTEISDRILRTGGPALLFENPKGFNVPVLTNLFGTEQRVALGMGMGMQRQNRSRIQFSITQKELPATAGIHAQ